MSYKIRRKFTTAGDNHYMSSFDRETDSFEATRFNSREEAERAIKRNLKRNYNKDKRIPSYTSIRERYHKSVPSSSREQENTITI